MSISLKVPFSPPCITSEDKRAVLKALDSQWLSGGQNTAEFEENFARYVGAKHAIAVGNCTEALHLAMEALNIRRGDEVIVPTMTFCATANAAIFCGAIPVFADIEEDSFTISPTSIKSKINSRTKAIVPVHFAGIPSDMEEIMGIAKRDGLFVVEDCAHSLGATYKGKQTGSIGNIGCFSFYATKNLCCGEGGMITTDSDELAKKMRQMRTHCMSKEALDRSNGKEWKYDVVGLGYNYRMPDYVAALGNSQLSRIDKLNAKRAMICQYYDEQLSKVKGIKTLKWGDGKKSAYHLYVIRVNEKEFGMSRNELFKKLAERHIECSVFYTPLTLLSYYKERYGCKPSDCPTATKVYESILALPLFNGIMPYQMEYIVRSVQELAG